MGTVSAVSIDYHGPLTGNYLNLPRHSVGIQFGAYAYLNDALNLGINSAFAPTVNYPDGEDGYTTPSMVDANALIQFKFNNGMIFQENAFFAPYLSTGIGLNSVRNRVGLYLPVALGMRFRITPGFYLNVESMFKQSVGSQYQHIAHSAGLVFHVPGGTRKESVKPSRDIPAQALSAAPQPAQIQRTMAPLADRDGDGIPDMDDACPELAGLVQMKGCPREVLAQTQTPAVEKGQAPASKALHAEALNSRAASPEPPSLAKAVPVSASPEMIKIDPIYFDVHSDKLNTEAIAALEKVAKLMEQYPDAKLKLEGFTDESGADRDNTVLAIKRAFNVKYYLVYEKGIRMARIESNGAAEKKAAAATENHAQNRKVEVQFFASVN